MNEVKITELNELESANVNNNDVLPIVDVSADETKKIKIENIKTTVNDSYSTSTTEPYSANYINNLPSGEGGGIIALKSITTAPSTFSEGDKYYNATDDLIYTATSSSTWDEGTTASAVSLYLNEIDNELYRYYNNAMNLLESGSGGGETLPVGSEIDFDGNVSDIPEGWEQVDDVPVYSTTETICGTWIDGSSIYRKVINCGALPNANEKLIAHNIANLSMVINIRGITYRASQNDYFPLPYINPLNSQTDPATMDRSIGLWTDITDIHITTGNDRSPIQTCYVIIEYTKTTN